MGDVRVLVVDDSDTVRKILRRGLEGAGYGVVEARNGTEALQLIEAGLFDLITLDIDMPDMTGFEVCAGLRSLEARLAREHTPVILITGNDTVEDRQRGFEVGAADFIVKPVKEVELVARVERILKAEQSLTGLTALVTDDSVVTRRVVASSLKEQGLKVFEAANGEEALAVLRRPDCPVDILITDIDMPGMGGGELCRRVRTSLGMPWLPIIFLSGMAEMGSVLEMFAAGATDYLVKPFAKEELIARISVHIEIRRLNLERAKRIQELERLHRLKDSFLAIASHDLRAPLNGIIGTAELMLMEEELPASYREYAEMISRSGYWLLAIIGDLLDLARLEAARDQQELLGSISAKPSRRRWMRYAPSRRPRALRSPAKSRRLTDRSSSMAIGRVSRASSPTWCRTPSSSRRRQGRSRSPRGGPVTAERLSPSRTPGSAFRQTRFLSCSIASRKPHVQARRANRAPGSAWPSSRNWSNSTSAESKSGPK